MYITGGLGVALAIVFFLWRVADARLDDVREELATARSNIQIEADANQHLKGTLDECLKINAQNKEQRDQAAQKAADAERKVIDLQIELAAIGTNVEKTDDECRTMDAPLPVDFTDQLCIAGAKNCRTD
jgi:chromosome segregation ATPase